MSMIEKFSLKIFTEGFKKFFNNLGRLAVIITAAASGYAASEIYHRYETGVKATKMQKPKTAQEVKVYINDNELMLMDIKTGTYQLYDKEVTNVIFGLKANHLYNSAQNGK